MKSNSYAKRPTRFSLIPIALSFFFMFCLYSATAQRQRPLPQLELGQSISGADHPEFFSRYQAFHTMLTVLAIRPEDALNLQRRARAIEHSLIGLNIQDASALEMIVEEFRTKELVINYQVAQLKKQGNATRENFLALNAKRRHLISDTAFEVKSTLSIEGNREVVAYMNHIISKSVIQRTASPISGGQK